MPAIFLKPRKSEWSCSPGGKAGINTKNLFELSATATQELIGPPYDIAIASTNITVAGQTLGPDGNLWFVYADGGDPLDVTPQPDVPTYSFTVDQNKFLLRIQANGNTPDLEPDVLVSSATNFCVGQNVAFALDGLPIDGSVTATNFTWTLAGTYVNECIPAPNPNCSDFYTNDLSLLHYPVLQTNWWTSGSYTNPPPYTATVTCDLIFANGNPKQPFNVSGLFTMFKPNVTWVGTIITPVVTVDMNFTGSSQFPPGPYSIEDWLHFGGYYNMFNQVIHGITFTYTGIDYGAFPGSFAINQLIVSSTVVNCQTNGQSIHQSMSGKDGSLIKPYDEPGTACHVGEYQVSDSSSYQTFIMFQPSGGTGGIAVPLKIIAWNWSGVADRNNTWYLASTEIFPR